MKVKTGFNLLIAIAIPTSDVNKDGTRKDKDKDKDQAYKDQDKDKTCKDKDKDKDLTHKDQDKDKDLNLVFKESLRTRTMINVIDTYRTGCL